MDDAFETGNGQLSEHADEVLRRGYHHAEGRDGVGPAEAMAEFDQTERVLLRPE
jgi:hypothetical protein